MNCKELFLSDDKNVHHSTVVVEPDILGLSKRLREPVGPTNQNGRSISFPPLTRMFKQFFSRKPEKKSDTRETRPANKNELRIALITANLGGIDPDLRVHHCYQAMPKGWKLEKHYFSDTNFPPRFNAMHPRLQAKIPRMFAWKMLPGYDYYIWLDAAFTLSHEQSVKWFVRQCRKADIALFGHPERNSIKEELEYMETEMSQGLQYLINRYAGEPMREQVQTYLEDERFIDQSLFATGAFIYRDTTSIRKLMTNWFTHCCLYSVQDQLSFPYLAQVTGCRVKTLDGNQLNNQYVKYHWSHLRGNYSERQERDIL